MRLSHLTFTGADDAVDPGELARLSADAPLIEWGILFSAELAGRPRFPSLPWRRAFYRAAPLARRAAHLCGPALLQRLADGPGGDPFLAHELRGDDADTTLQSPAPYQRMQLNFTLGDLPPETVAAWAAAWHAGGWRNPAGVQPGLITQHNAANERVHAWFAGAGGHGVLFDASGGRGLRPVVWPAPLPGLQCGYAGGLSPDTVEQALAALATTVGDRTIWIDMEAGVRDGDRFDLDRVRAVIERVRACAGGAALVPGVALTEARGR